MPRISYYHLFGLEFESLASKQFPVAVGGQQRCLELIGKSLDNVKSLGADATRRT